MHICLIADYFPPHIGGIETLFGDLAEFFLKQGHTVTIISSKEVRQLDSKTVPSSVIRNSQSAIQQFTTGTSRTNFIPHLLRFGVRNRKLFQSFDHIHTTTFAAALGANILAKWYRKPITVTIHEIYDLQRDYLKGVWKGWWYRLYEYILCQILSRDHIVTPSKYTKERLQSIHQIDKKDITVVYNQIDYGFRQNTKNLKHQKSKALYIGRLGKEKGLTRLLDSLPFVIDQIPNFVLTIIAPKTSRMFDKATQQQIRAISKQIKDARLQHHIHWIDPLTNDKVLLEEFGKHQIGIVPSLSEGFCYTALQMEASGLALVVSDIPTFHEVLDQEIGHRFVARGDCQGLAEAIIEQVRSIDLSIKPVKKPEPKFESTLEGYTLSLRGTKQSNNN